MSKLTNVPEWDQISKEEEWKYEKGNISKTPFILTENGDLGIYIRLDLMSYGCGFNHHTCFLIETEKKVKLNLPSWTMKRMKKKDRLIGLDGEIAKVILESNCKLLKEAKEFRVFTKNTRSKKNGAESKCFIGLRILGRVTDVEKLKEGIECLKSLVDVIKKHS